MLKAEIRRINGIPTMFANGVRQTPLMLFTNTEIDEGTRRDICGAQIRMAAAHGLHLHSVCCHLNVGEPRGSRGLESAVAAMETAIGNDPEAKILLRVNVTLYGRDAAAWENTHPGDGVRFALHSDGCHMVLDGSGGYRELPNISVSLASDAWLDAAIDAVCELHEWVSAHPILDDHLLGYHISAASAGEWFHDGIREYGVDISDANRRRYREWLHDKYGDVEKLNRSWCLRAGAYTSFDQVEIPADIPGNDRSRPAERTLFIREEDQKYLDFSDYSSWIVTDRILKLAKAAREATHGDKLLLFFYGYYYELYDARTGHFRLNDLLESPYLDAFASPISYIDRNQGGTGAMMAPVDSITLHGKLWLVENDLRTGQVIRSHSDNDTASWLNKPIDSIEHVMAVYRREAAQMMARGIGCWYMDLMGRGWLYHPMIWDCIAELHDLYASMQEDGSLRPLTPDVAVVLDESAMCCVAHAEQCGARLVHSLRQNFYRAGIKFGWYTVEDVENGLVPSAKLIWFLNPFQIARERCDKLCEIARKQGAAMVFMHGFGRTAADIVCRLTGMTIGMDAVSLANLAMDAPELLPEGKRFLPDAEDLRRQIESPAYWDPVQTANPASWVEAAGQGTLEPLAWYTQGRLRGKIGAALCRHDGLTSVFVGAMQLTADGIREICRRCGIHIYSETDDALMIGDHVLAIHAAKPTAEQRARASAVNDGEVEAHHLKAVQLTDGQVIRLKKPMKMDFPAEKDAACDELSACLQPGETQLWICRHDCF